MASPRPRRLEYLPVDDLRGHPDNPKEHDTDLLGDSFARWGYVEPQVLDERTGLLIAGHGRLERLLADQAAGDTPPQGIVVAKADGRWLVPVVRGWASTDDREALAYLIASNRSTIAGGWDDDRLAPLLESLAEGAEGLAGVGYTPADIDLLIAGIRQGGLDGTDADAEWVGMPAFDQPYLDSKYTTTVHFLTADDAERFARETFGLDGATRSLWWPKHDGHKGSDQTVEYVAAADDPAG